MTKQLSNHRRLNHLIIAALLLAVTPPLARAEPAATQPLRPMQRLDAASSDADFTALINEFEANADKLNPTALVETIFHRNKEPLARAYFIRLLVKDTTLENGGGSVAACLRKYTENRTLDRAVLEAYSPTIRQIAAQIQVGRGALGQGMTDLFMLLANHVPEGRPLAGAALGRYLAESPAGDMLNRDFLGRVLDEDSALLRDVVMADPLGAAFVQGRVSFDALLAKKPRAALVAFALEAKAPRLTKEDQLALLHAVAEVRFYPVAIFRRSSHDEAFLTDPAAFALAVDILNAPGRSQRAGVILCLRRSVAHFPPALTPRLLDYVEGERSHDESEVISTLMFLHSAGPLDAASGKRVEAWLAPDHAIYSRCSKSYRVQLRQQIFQVLEGTSLSESSRPILEAELKTVPPGFYVPPLSAFQLLASQSDDYKLAFVVVLKEYLRDEHRDTHSMLRPRDETVVFMSRGWMVASILLRMPRGTVDAGDFAAMEALSHHGEYLPKPIDELFQRAKSAR